MIPGNPGVSSGARGWPLPEVWRLTGKTGRAAKTLSSSVWTLTGVPVTRRDAYSRNLRGGQSLGIHGKAWQEATTNGDVGSSVVRMHGSAITPGFLS